MRSLSHRVRQLLKFRSGNPGGPVHVTYRGRKVELIPDALGRQATLVRLTDTSAGDHVDAIVQRAMLDEPDAVQRLAEVIDQLDADLQQ